MRRDHDSRWPPCRVSCQTLPQHAPRPIPFQVDPVEAARTIGRRFREAALRNARLERQARENARRLVQMIIQEFQPKRIYQWGSLTRHGAFRDFSDIDLAVEGVTEPELFFRMLGRCMELSDFPVDLVQMECLDPLRADEIRAHGCLLWERPS